MSNLTNAELEKENAELKAELKTALEAKKWWERGCTDRFNELTEVKKELNKSKAYCSSMLTALVPGIEVLDDLTGMLSQLDNVIAGSISKIGEVLGEIDRLTEEMSELKKRIAVLNEEN